MAVFRAYKVVAPKLCFLVYNPINYSYITLAIERGHHLVETALVLQLFTALNSLAPRDGGKTAFFHRQKWLSTGKIPAIGWLI